MNGGKQKSNKSCKSSAMLENKEHMQRYKQEEEAEEEQNNRKSIIISPSSCPISTWLLIDLGAWSLLDPSGRSMKGFRAVWALCASRRESRPCIWPCRS
jgi:hypothetical protein